MAKIKLANTSNIELTAYSEIDIQSSISVIPKESTIELSANTDKGLFSLELSRNEMIELIEKINNSL